MSNRFVVTALAGVIADTFSNKEVYLSDPQIEEALKYQVEGAKLLDAALHPHILVEILTKLTVCEWDRHALAPLLLLLKPLDTGPKNFNFDAAVQAFRTNEFVRYNNLIRDYRRTLE